MMKPTVRLINCQVCNHQVASDAPSCPYCGTRDFKSDAEKAKEFAELRARLEAETSLVFFYLVGRGPYQNGKWEYQSEDMSRPIQLKWESYPGEQYPRAGFVSKKPGLIMERYRLKPGTYCVSYKASLGIYDDARLIFMEKFTISKGDPDKKVYVHMKKGGFFTKPTMELEVVDA